MDRSIVMTKLKSSCELFGYKVLDMKQGVGSLDSSLVILTSKMKSPMFYIFISTLEGEQCTCLLRFGDKEEALELFYNITEGDCSDGCKSKSA